MALSWARKLAAPPVSSPARQDRCKVGGETQKTKIDQENEKEDLTEEYVGFFLGFCSRKYHKKKRKGLLEEL